MAWNWFGIPFIWVVAVVVVADFALFPQLASLQCQCNCMYALVYSQACRNSFVFVPYFTCSHVRIYLSDFDRFFSSFHYMYNYFISHIFIIFLEFVFAFFLYFSRSLRSKLQLQLLEFCMVIRFHLLCWPQYVLTTDTLASIYVYFRFASKRQRKENPICSSFFTHIAYNIFGWIVSAENLLIPWLLHISGYEFLPKMWALLFFVWYWQESSAEEMYL